MGSSRALDPAGGAAPMLALTSVRLACREDGVAVAWIDVPDRPVNVLTDALGDELEQVLARVEREAGVRALVLASAKRSGFLAGADVSRLAACRDEDEALELSRRAQGLMDRVARLAVPAVAAVHGACLGGGLELALACRARVAADDGDTLLGAPEVRLGLLPGAGGTVRLPALIGVRRALELVLTGRRVVARTGKGRRLVDEVVPRWVLVEAAAARARRLSERGTERGPGPTRWLRAETWSRRALEGTALGRRVLFSKAAERTRARTHGHYPAPEAILEVVRTGLEQGREAGLAAERRAFARLWATRASRELVRVFLGSKRLEREADAFAAEHDPAPVRRLTVVGAGLMGGGIAAVSAQDECLVRLADLDDEALSDGLGAVDDALADRVRRGRLDEAEARRARRRVTGTTGRRGLAAADLVIEAVPEDVDLKREVLGGLEAGGGPRLVLASNTSSIPIGELAEGLHRPERCVGMHYFSPVEKMPLIEIVHGERTADEVVAAALAVGRAQGKTPVVVADGPGFYTTRILAPYLIEAVTILAEGVRPRAIDDALVAFGFPVGPLQVADEVGVDVAGKIAEVLHERLGARMEPPGVLRALIEDGRRGKKSGAGFYRYADGRRRDDASALFSRLGVRPVRGAIDAQAIADRCALRMIDEAARCLDEGVLASAEDGDLAAVLGLGFPPFRGGPFRYVDDEGAGALVERMRALAARHGERLRPCARLAAHAEDPRARFHRAPQA